MRRPILGLLRLIDALRDRLEGIHDSGTAILYPAVAGTCLFRLVLISFPLIDLLTRQEPVAWGAGGASVAVIVVAQIVIMLRVLRGGLRDTVARVLASVEFLVGVAVVYAFGKFWIATPVFGLVDVLLCLDGVALAGVTFVGMTAYVLGVARLYEPVELLAQLGEFGLSVLVLYAVPKLAIALRELHKARAEVAALALANERVRVARDLHDTLGQSLSVVLLKLDVVERVAANNPPRRRRELAETRTLLRGAVEEMQRVVSGLRQTTLPGEIASACSVLNSAGIATTASVEDLNLCPEVAEALAWVVREGTTNVLRHSTASRCEIVLRSCGPQVELCMTNDGQPLSSPLTPSGGTGISGLQQRLQSIDGVLSTGPGAAGGFTISANVPGGGCS